MTSDPQGSEFFQQYRGELWALRQWDDLDRFWALLRDQASAGWYVYAVGEEPPEQSSPTEDVLTFITRIDELLHAEHQESYCGIVYTDNRQQPSFIKIYDPNNLGMVCGSSAEPPLPGWIVSLAPPIDLPSAVRPPNNRRRWWQSLFRQAS